MGKSLDDLTKGDMDAYRGISDNAAVLLNSGDSLVGKPAIDKYWRRRANVLKTIIMKFGYG
jgi:hypothetical protein